MAKKSLQSIEPKVADIVNGWLKEYQLKYFLEQGSMNAEIDAALQKAPSKSGGYGRNRVDAKLILEDRAMVSYPIMIEYKGYKDKLAKLDKLGMVENLSKNDEPNYKNINDYAVNGAVHYSHAVLQYTGFTEVFAIGVTGYETDFGNVSLEIGVYFVSKKNKGIAKKVGDYTDLSFLKKENFDAFVLKAKELLLSAEELEASRKRDENRIDNALTRINERIYNKEQNLSALSRVHLVSASIIANLGIPNKVAPLEPKDLKSSIENDFTDGDIMMRKIKSFLQEKNIPLKKQQQILRMKRFPDLKTESLY